MIGLIRAALASAVCCLALCACTGKPGKSGTVVPDTGGRDGNTISLGGRDEVLLMYDDDYLKPSQGLGISHIGDRITIQPAAGGEIPAWLVVGTPHRTSRYWSDVLLTFQPQQVQPHTEQVTLRVTVSDPDGTNAVFADMPVRAVRAHRLSRRRDYQNFTVGSASPPARRLELIVNGAWIAELAEPWGSMSISSGTGNATIDFTTAPQGLAVGNYIGGFFVRHQSDQRTAYYTMYLGVDPRRLETDKRALAFSSNPGASRLTRQIRVIDTAGLQGQWRLSDDAAWLSASAAAGAGDATITITADPTGLAEGIHRATLTLAPDNETGFANDSTVRVGLHVNRSAAGNSPVTLGSPPAAGLVTADPVRPFVYGLTNTAGYSTLRVWNVHTGALVDSVVLPNVTAARAHVSPDGALLLVSDTVHEKFVPIILGDDARTPGAPWTSMLFIAGFNDFAFARLSGAMVVVFSGSNMISAQTGERLTFIGNIIDYHPNTSPPSIAIADDGRRGCMVIRNGATSRLLFLSLGNRGMYTAGLSDPAMLGGDAYDCVLDSSGANVYAVTSTTIYRFAFQSLQPEIQRPVTRGGNLQRIDSGDIYLAGEDGAWTHYDADLVEIARRQVGTGSLYGIVSGDETRVLELTETSGQLGATLRDRDF